MTRFRGTLETRHRSTIDNIWKSCCFEVLFAGLFLSVPLHRVLFNAFKAVFLLAIMVGICVEEVASLLPFVKHFGGW